MRLAPIGLYLQAVPIIGLYLTSDARRWYWTLPIPSAAFVEKQWLGRHNQEGGKLG